MNIAETRYAGNIYLNGNFAPVAKEVTAFDLEVIGEIPAGLEGSYLRNGPNPVNVSAPEQHHWFAGPGMVHGVRLRGGKAEWYRNRWVRSQAVGSALGEEVSAGQPGSAPNTNVARWAGLTLALVEAGGAPVALSDELDTLGESRFGGTLPGAFSAHPKFDPLTREWHAMCYCWPQWRDHIQYVVVGPDGRVSRTVDIPLPGMVMVHDMSLTRRYAVVYDLPVMVDPELVAAGRFPYRCSVVIDICRYERMFDRDTLGPAGDGLPRLYRWTVDPVRRTVGQQQLDDRAMEFPRVASSVSTLRHRFGYGAGVGEGFAPGDIHKHDRDRGTVEVHALGTGRGAGEPDFVPREHPRSEDDGWLMSYVYDATVDRSELVILDARDLAVPPVARVLLPQRVPFGFHGNWISDHEAAT